MSGKMDRRTFLSMAATGAAGLALGGVLGVTGAGHPSAEKTNAPAAAKEDLVPFYGAHQAGIVTPQQLFANVAAFDVTTDDVKELKEMLRSWTEMIARLTQGKPLDKGDPDPKFPPVDTGEDAGLQTARLTVTVGFGASLFEKDGADRFGFRSKKPLGLTEMPKFHGDSLQEMWTHGDIVVQACADDPIVCFHAIRNLAKASRGVAHLRWQQSGQWGMQKEGTRRNLFGFKDGTNNPDVNDEAFMKRNIWIAPEDGQAWLAGGTYMVVRRINMRIETWDQLTFKEQEETIGRKKASGSPMDGQNEFDAPNYAADPDGKKTPLDSHVRLSNPRTGEASERERILRRGFNFMEPLDAVGRINAGLLFICFNRSIQNQFASIQQRLSNPRQPDKLLSYTQTNGGGYFVVPPGVQRQGQFLGEGLFL